MSETRNTNGAPVQNPIPGLSYRPNVLIAEDDHETAQQLRQLLEADLGLHVDTTGDGKEALEALRKNFYSIFITDLKLPRLDGLKLIHEIAKERIPVTVIVMTGHGSVDNAVEAMRAGAYDFLTKPLDLDRLNLILKRALQERALRDEVVYLREQLGASAAFRHIITKSRDMMSILELINNVAQTSTTVLVEGETGTGKEMIARAIHEASGQLRTGPLIAINCAALPESLLESELFGHEKGAFTGAIAQRKGRFEQANGGTIFLDEVGEIPQAMQVKLLRVLQERRFERVGGTESIDVDVRVIAATNRSLARMVKRGTFREDLYYRVNVVRLALPPLRDRPEDIPLLVKHFCARYSRPGEKAKEIAPEAMEILLHHAWPGNVRELENVIERACVTSRGKTITREQFSSDLLQPEASQNGSVKVDLNRPLPELLREVTADVERRYLRKALRKTRGNVGRCAKLCGLSRRTVTSKIAEHQIDKEALKEA